MKNRTFDQDTSEVIIENDIIYLLPLRGRVYNTKNSLPVEYVGNRRTAKQHLGAERPLHDSPNGYFFHSKMRRVRKV